MSQPNPQHTQAPTASSLLVSPARVSASMTGLRTVAMSLLVDRALSA